MNIEQAALAERNAEQGREQAEAAWRSAWWVTTLELAKPAEGDKLGVGKALDTAQRILGQDRSYLSERRRLGRRFIVLEHDEISTLAPRLALEYMKSGGDPAQAIARLRGAEARNLSLRDFAAELGTQPTSWQREGERAANMPQAQRVEIARAAIADPELGKEVMADFKTRVRAVDAAHAVDEANEARVRKDRQQRVDDGQRPDFEGATAIRRVLVDLDELVVDAGRMPKIIPDGYKVQLARKAAQAKPTMDWLASLGSGAGVPDDLSELGLS